MFANEFSDRFTKSIKWWSDKSFCRKMIKFWIKMFFSIRFNMRSKRLNKTEQFAIVKNLKKIITLKKLSMSCSDVETKTFFERYDFIAITKFLKKKINKLIFFISIWKIHRAWNRCNHWNSVVFSSSKFNFTIFISCCDIIDFSEISVISSYLNFDAIDFRIIIRLFMCL